MNFQCHQTLLCFLAQILYTLVKRSQLKSKFLRHSNSGVKIGQIVVSILKQQVNFSSNFVTFFIAMMHNSSVNFKLNSFLLWITVFHQSPNFETFKCPGKNLPNSSMSFSKPQVSFSSNLHQSSIWWNINPLYFFSSKIIYFAQKESIEVQIFETFECPGQNL